MKPRMYIRGSAHRAGFSFAEVMFAVVILGIGFIMVAAVFPVTIQQTKATGEENIAAEVARNAVKDVTSLPGTVNNPLYNSAYTYNASAPNPATDYESVQTELVLPPTVKNYVPGTINTTVSMPIYSGSSATATAISTAPPAVVVPFTGPRWDAIKGNIIQASDPRYSYVAFYRRESGASMAQLIVISVTNRQRPIYTASTDTAFTGVASDQIKYPQVTTTPAAFPSTATAVGTPTTIYPDTITINSGYPQEGFYLQTPYPPPVYRTYRLGRQLSGQAYGYPASGSMQFELEPGDDMLLTAASTGWGTPGTWNASAGKWVNGGIYDPALSGGQTALYPTTTLQPSVAYAQLQLTTGSLAGQIVLRTGPGVNANYTSTDNLPPPQAAPGAFIIVADDYPFSTDPAYSPTTGYALPPNLTYSSSSVAPVGYINYQVGALNGRIFRLGQQVTKDTAGNPQVGVYNLDPAYGMRPAVSSGPAYSPDTFPNPDYLSYEASVSTPIPNYSSIRAKVFIFGMGRDTPGHTLGGPNTVNAPTYSKGAQDIGVFTTYIPVQ